MVKIEQEEPNSSCASAAALEEIEKWRNFVANRAQGHSNSSGGGAEIICAENEKMGTNVWIYFHVATECCVDGFLQKMNASKKQDVARSLQINRMMRT